MLLVNGTYLDPLDKENPHTKLYLDVLDKILKKYKKYPINLKFPERFKIFNELAPSKPIWPGGYHIWYKDRLPTKEGSDEWQYYESTHREGNGDQNYLPRGYNFNKNGMRIDSTKKDLAFFMLYVCSRCENSMNHDVLNNGLDKYFMVDDPRRESEDRINKIRTETMAKNLIISEGLEREIRQTAKAYNIANATRIDVNDPSAKKYAYDANGVLIQEHEAGIPYIMSVEEVRDVLLQTAEKMSMADSGIWEKIVDRLQVQKVITSNKDIFDKLIENRIIKLTDSEPTKTGMHAGKSQKEWAWCDGYDKDENGKEKKTLHRCGYENKTDDECMNSLLNRMDTQTPFKLMFEKVLKEAVLE